MKEDKPTRLKFLKRFLQLIIVIGLMLGTGGVVLFFVKTKPAAVEKEISKTKPLVEVLPVTLRGETIAVPSQGVVQAKRRTQLAAELSGRVVWISDKFVVGGKFEAFDEILRIDESTYVSTITQEQASVVEAEVALTSEKARAAQAKRDWARLGRGQASELTLRIPQIRSAEARISAAKAALEGAKIDVERTVIRAPFAATVANKTTEIGNFVAPGSLIGEFFQTDPLEIRMSMPLDDLRFLQTDSSGNIVGDLILYTKLGDRTVEWQAKVDRTEGQVDQQSRSIFMISDIKPTDHLKSGNPIKLQPGLFLNASVTGKQFENLARVPASAFLDLNRVVLVDRNNTLRFRKVEVLRREGDIVFVSGGLEQGDRLCLTELTTLIEGTEVDVREFIDPLEADFGQNNR